MPLPNLFTHFHALRGPVPGGPRVTPDAAHPAPRQALSTLRQVSNRKRFDGNHPGSFSAGFPGSVLLAGWAYLHELGVVILFWLALGIFRPGSHLGGMKATASSETGGAHVRRIDPSCPSLGPANTPASQDRPGLGRGCGFIIGGWRWATVESGFTAGGEPRFSAPGKPAGTEPPIGPYAQQLQGAPRRLDSGSRLGDEVDNLGAQKIEAVSARDTAFSCGSYLLRPGSVGFALARKPRAVSAITTNSNAATHRKVVDAPRWGYEQKAPETVELSGSHTCKPRNQVSPFRPGLFCFETDGLVGFCNAGFLRTV